MKQVRNKLLKNALVYLVFCLFSTLSIAAPPLEFDNDIQEKRFNSLVAEIRCLVCQNQNLADSDAELAQDLRREVLELIRSGKSDAQVKDFLVQRYGEFVLYRPRLEKATYLLWLGPIVLLLFGAVVMGFILRKNNLQFKQNKSDDKDEHQNVD